MENIEIKDFKSSTYLYESLIDHIKDVADDDIKLRKLLKAIEYIRDVNTGVLDTNIIGPALLINENNQKNVLDAIGLNKKDLIALCKKSPRLNGVGKVVDQFAFALPLLILSGCLYSKKKIELSQQIFLFTFFRPYASKITTFFRLGVVDEAAMEYTVNVELTEKSYIKKYGSVYKVLSISAKSAYDSFIEPLSAKDNAPTDDLLFNNIFYSAIFSKTGSWIKAVYGTYLDVKKSGKAIGYESSVFSSYDDDSGNDQYEENNINSNSYAKREFVSRAITKFNISPIDTKLVSIAATIGYGGTSNIGESFLKTIINNIVETKSEFVPIFFDAIIGSFLDSEDDNGKRNAASDIKTIKFLAYSKRLIKTSHTYNTNIHEEQNILESFLTECYPVYNTRDPKTQRKMRLSLFMYFAMFIQKA